MDNVNFGIHSLAERPEPRSHKLELDFEKLLLHDCGNEDLNLEIEHVVLRDGLADLKEILLPPAIVIVNQEAARVPVVICVIENFELDERCLACLHSRVVLILGDSILLRNVLYVR